MLNFLSYKHLVPKGTKGMSEGHLEIESYAEADLALSQGALRHEKLIDEGLSLRGGGTWAKRAKVDELAAKAEYGGVQDVVEFSHQAQAHLFVEPELARDVQIKNELTRARARV